MIEAGGDSMDELYKDLYFHLFNQITDALEEMERQNFGRSRDILIRAQQETEETYLNAKGN